MLFTPAAGDRYLFGMEDYQDEEKEMAYAARCGRLGARSTARKSMGF
jgi:hypothetical protein